MSTSVPYIGIDFGTTYSSTAWYNPGNNPPYTGRAEIIQNTEGRPKTPSLVYFDENETLVGELADKILEDASDDQARREEVFQRTVKSIKRDLIAPPRISLPGGRSVRPVEVAAEIIGKLKRDAEKGVFHKEVPRAVITCPAEFNAIQRQVIERAGRMVGFDEVVLLEEPVAGALAYARAGLDVGRHVLVYDLGGGTFDLAVLDNEDESFHVALEPKGIDKCGGDDFDLALYYHCDELAREKLGRPISLTDTIDLKFLRECRERKENLSARKRFTASSTLPGYVLFKHELDREEFHELIRDYVETTVRLTEAIVKEAEEGEHAVDTVVLIGGSSRVLLIKELLNEALPVAPLDFHERDVAVALGAAHYAHMLWGGDTTRNGGGVDRELLAQYRRAVEEVGSGGRLNKAEVDRLKTFAAQLPLSEERAAEVEREVLGETKEAILFRSYREALEMVWADEKLNGLEAIWLRAFARELGLDRGQAAEVEREVMGGTKEKLFEPSLRPEVSDEPAEFLLGHTLAGHSGEVNSVAFSADGKFLASGSADRTVRGWNLGTGESVGTLSGPLERINSVAFSPDGGFLASGGLDKMVRVWKLPNGEPLHTLNHSEWIFSVTMSPDGRLLASGGADKEIKLWNLETGELLRTLAGHSHWVLSAAMSPDGELLASGAADGTLNTWNPRTGELSSSFEHPGWVWSVAVSPDGKLISGCEDGAIRVWDHKTGELLRTIAGRSGPVSSVAASPDGRLLFGGGSSGRIEVYGLKSGQLLNVLPGHRGGVGSVALSSDGRLLASGGADREIKVWRRGATERANVSDSGGERVSSLSLPSAERYRSIVKNIYGRAWDTAGEAKNRLNSYASDLGLRPDQAATVEREVMGNTKETVFRGSDQTEGGEPSSLGPDSPPSEAGPRSIRPTDLPD